jgi:GLPGLI family protein
MKLNTILDIDKNNVKFYDYDFVKYDSISKNTGTSWTVGTTSDQLISRKFGSFENKSFYSNYYDYFVITSNDEMIWKLEPETKKIGEYSLKKATTNFGGRNWTAWFSPEIPFQEGPYKFRGLPGLIFELNDDKNDYVYSLVKSINLPETFDTTGFLETHYGTKAIPISLKQYHKIKLDYYNDPMKSLKESLKSGGEVLIDSEKITSLDQLDQKKIYMQETLKKYYNPVELDKAIPYPK